MELFIFDELNDNLLSRVGAWAIHGRGGITVRIFVGSTMGLSAGQG